jgi:hypothetical protein
MVKFIPKFTNCGLKSNDFFIINNPSLKAGVIKRLDYKGALAPLINEHEFGWTFYLCINNFNPLLCKM